MRDFEIELGQLINAFISSATRTNPANARQVIDQIIEALDMNVLLLEERRAPASPAVNGASGADAD
jgi:hypothetical protein